MATGKAIIYKGIPYFSGEKVVPTRVSQLANDAGYVTTDEKVKQTPTTENASYRILLSNDADDTEHVNKVFKNTDLKYNPWTKTLSLSNGGEIYLYPDTDIDTSFAWLDNSKLSVHDYDTERSILQLTATDLVFPRLTIEGTTYLNTWDGTNTSLKTSITSLRNDKVNRSGDTMSGQLKGKNPASSWIAARDNACFRNPNFANNGSYYPVISTKSKSGAWSIGVLSNEEQLNFCWESDSNYNSGKNESTRVILRATAGTIALTSELPRNSSGVIKVKSVNKTPTNAGTSLASPKPSIDSGYKFLCWLYVQSNGYVVGANYPGGATATNATWWFANGYLANYALTFYYLEIKDTI